MNLQNVGNPDMPAAMGNGSIDAGLMYGEHFLDREEAGLLFEALAQADDELQGDARHSDEYLEIVGNAIGQSGEDLESVPLYTWYSDLRPLPDQLAAMESVWLEYGALTYDSPLDPEEYIDSSFSDAVDRE